MGEYTPHNYFYKPAYGASGKDEKQKFDDALDYVDSRISISSGSIDWSVISVTSDYTLNNKDFVLVDGSEGSIDIMLTTASIGSVGNIKRIDNSTNNVYITCSNTTIDGMDSIRLDFQYECYAIISDGNNWFIM